MPDGGLLVAVDGLGVVALDRSGRESGRLGEAAGVPLGCVTALAVAADGTVFLTDGSGKNGAGRWLEDLMQKRPGSGRLVSCAPGLTGAKVLLDGLSWPAGACVSHDERHVLVSEAWAHRLLSVSRHDRASRALVKNFTGYPSRIARAAGGGYWIAFFALRTQLTEFVLREDAFRSRMMQTVPADLWIGPSLGGRFDYREPTQIGRIKKLGIQKPWAPPRSYGLVVRVDEAGNAVESLHSRVAGEVHGITDVAERGGRLLVASKGHGKLCLADIGRPS